MDGENTASKDDMSSEDKLVELAKKELLRDVKCASMRAEQFGAHSWAKPQKYAPSKRFLRYMLVNASKTNLRKTEHSDSKTRHESSYSYSNHKLSNKSFDRNENKRSKSSRWDSPKNISSEKVDSDSAKYPAKKAKYLKNMKHKEKR